ncbi:MAG: LCP family protein [bacterium]
MNFTNPFLKIKRITSKKSSVSRIKSEKEIAKPKVAFLSKFARVVISLGIIAIVLCFIYLSIPNILAINSFEPKTFDKNTSESTIRKVNILLIVKDEVNGYEKLKTLDLVSYDESSKVINIKAINTKTIVGDSSLGKNVSIENSYQLNLLKGGSDFDNLKFFENLLAVKLDYYLIVPMDYFKDSLKLMGGILFANDYTSDKFPKGNVMLTGDNISTFWNSTYANDGQSLVEQNKFLQTYFSKLGSFESFLNYSRLSEVSKMYLDTNMSLSFYTDLFRNAIFNANKINFGFSPTQLFLNTKDGKYWNIDKFDEYIKNEFSDTKIQREQARVEVQNASGTSGLATKVARFVSNSGAEVSRVGNFGIEVPKTTVYVKDQNKFAETVNFLENLLTNAEFRFESPEKLSTADILIIVKEF